MKAGLPGSERKRQPTPWHLIDPLEGVIPAILPAWRLAAPNQQPAIPDKAGYHWPLAWRPARPPLSPAHWGGEGEGEREKETSRLPCQLRATGVQCLFAPPTLGASQPPRPSTARSHPHYGCIISLPTHWFSCIPQVSYDTFQSTSVHLQPVDACMQSCHTF